MSIDLEAKAISFAAEKHGEQKRKLSGESYIVHPLEVGSYLHIMEVSESAICAGFLHDTLEDTDTTQQEIKDIFGEETLRIILSNTEDKSLSWEKRKQHTIENVKNLDTECFLLLLLDKFSNLQDMEKFYLTNGDELWSRFNRGKDLQGWYYESLLDEFLSCVRVHEFSKIQKFLVLKILGAFRESCVTLFNIDIPEISDNLMKESKWMRRWHKIQEYLRGACEIAVIFTIINIIWIAVEYLVLGYRNPNDVDTIMGFLMSAAIYYFRNN